VRNQSFRGNLFVSNLPRGCTDEKLAALFDDFGIVLGAFVARDAETGDLHNYGLVNIAPQRAATVAIEEMNGVEVEGRRLQVRAADPGKGLGIPSRPRSARPQKPSFHPQKPSFQKMPAERARPTFQVEYGRTRGRG